MSRVHQEIDNFHRLVAKLKSNPDLKIEEPIESSCVIRSKWAQNSDHNPKTIGLCIMALTHGNEVGGLASVNELLKVIADNPNVIALPLAIILGNIEAAKADKRFIDRDLNRSFSCADQSSAEAKRATEITKMLDNTHLLLDIHQTKEKSETPFFIFPYTLSGFSFARSLSLDIPIVTHWGKPFSKEGMCTDEYTNTKGGCGITLELGQNSFDPYHVAVGVHCALKAIGVAREHYYAKTLPNLAPSKLPDINTYGFAKVIDCPQEGDVALVDGLNNFSPVHSGQKIATVHQKDVINDIDALVLFPQYLRQKNAKRPTELIRLLKPLEANDLPQE